MVKEKEDGGELEQMIRDISGIDEEEKKILNGSVIGKRTRTTRLTRPSGRGKGWHGEPQKHRLAALKRWGRKKR